MLLHVPPLLMPVGCRISLTDKSDGSDKRNETHYAFHRLAPVVSLEVDAKNVLREVPAASFDPPVQLRKCYKTISSQHTPHRFVRRNGSALATAANTYPNRMRRPSASVRKPTQHPLVRLAATAHYILLPIPGRVAGRGAVLPVDLGYANKGTVAADLFVFARAARVLKGSRATSARSRSAFVLPCEVSLVASKIGDDAVTTRLALFVVHVGVNPCRTFDAGSMKQTVFTLVIKESPGELADPVKMTLLDFMSFADAKPAKLANWLPVVRLLRERSR